MPAQLGLERGQPGLQQVALEPGGELRQVPEHDVRPGRAELVLGAPAGQHGDAGDPGRQRSLDVVHVVAHVDARALRPEHVALAGAPDLAREVVHVEREVVDVELGVARVLAGHEQHPPVRPSYGSDRVVRAGERRRRQHRVVGVDLPEPVGGRRDLVLRHVVAQQVAQRGSEPGGHGLGRERDPELRPEHLQRRREPADRVDQRHVEVEPDHQLICHVTSLRRAVRGCDSGPHVRHLVARRARGAGRAGG